MSNSATKGNRVRNFIAFDCSNSSVRTLLAAYDGERIRLDTVARSPNQIIKGERFEYWNIGEIFLRMKDGLRQAVASGVHIDSIGVCTWGVDFAFLTKDGRLTGDPLAYRNPFGEEEWKKLTEAERSELFNETGILCDKINSIFLLQAVRKRFPERLEGAEHFLTIPDILNYYLTGEVQNEPSELSTTQLMDVRTGRVSRRVCEKAGLDRNLFAAPGRHGQKIGNLRPELCRELGIDYEIPVICVPSHDTAAAILAVPAESREFAYISSGTWALIGTELEEPSVDPGTEQAGFTNELGAFGRITLLRNHAGLFLLQRLREEHAPDADWESFNALADEEGEPAPVFDVNDSRFFNPENMGREIWQALTETGQVNGEFHLPTVIRSVLRSLAEGYRKTLEKLENVTGKTFPEIFIVGGGTQNVRLCRITADVCGRTVITGGTESTGLGNALAQIKYFEPEHSVETLRKIAGASVESKRYYPGRDVT